MSIFRTGLGQDSHRFLPEDSTKPCIIAGLIFEDVPGFKANSDGDVVFHALCNAISSLTGVLILGKIADELCLKGGITDSSVYLQEALLTLGKQRIEHIAISIEAARPHFLKHIDKMRESVAKAVGIGPHQVGVTATSGEGLNEFGCGIGVQCFCIVTTVERTSQSD